MKDNENIGIVIADEHAICREALRNLLEREPGFAITGEAADGEEALERVQSTKPAALLLDLAIPRLTAMDVLTRLRDKHDSTPVLLLADSLDGAQAVESLKLGARGVVLKESAPQILFKSIRAAVSGDYWVGRSITRHLVDALRDGGSTTQGDFQSAPFSLTHRELEIIAEVAEGCTNRNIAEKLSIAEQTVKHHLTSIFQKVGVANRLELAVFAMHRRIHPNA